MVLWRVLTFSLVLTLGQGIRVRNANSPARTSGGPAVRTAQVAVTPTDEGEVVTYEGAQLLRVETRSAREQHEIFKLEELGVLETWNEISFDSPDVDVFITQGNKKKVKDLLMQNNITYSVSIPDVQKLIEEQQNYEGNSTITPKHAGDSISLDAYHSLEDIYTYLQYLNDNYDSATLLNIGTTIEGRQIKGIRIYYRPVQQPGLGVVVEAGLHAREWASVSSALYILRELVEHESEYINIDGVIDTYFYIFPVLNPDGYEYSRKKDRLWRKNRRKNEYDDRHGRSESRHKKQRCYGVDLNRNFGYKWGGAGSSGNPCKETYRGTAAFSEPETKAYSDFINKEYDNNPDYFPMMHLSLHTYGQRVLYPWSYDRKLDEDGVFYQRFGNYIAGKMKEIQNKEYKVGGFGATTYPASGTAMDWAAGGADPHFAMALTCQLRDTGRFGFLLPAHEILLTGAEAFECMIGVFGI